MADQCCMVGWVQDYGWSPLCFGLRSRNGTATAPLNALTKMFMIPGFELPQLEPLSRQSLTPAPDDDTVFAGAVAVGGKAAVLWISHAPSNGVGQFNQTIEISGGSRRHLDLSLAKTFAFCSFGFVLMSPYSGLTRVVHWPGMASMQGNRRPRV